MRANTIRFLLQGLKAVAIFAFLAVMPLIEPHTGIGFSYNAEEARSLAGDLLQSSIVGLVGAAVVWFTPNKG